MRPMRAFRMLIEEKCFHSYFERNELDKSNWETTYAKTWGEIDVAVFKNYVTGMTISYDFISYMNDYGRMQVTRNEPFKIIHLDVNGSPSLEQREFIEGVVRVCD